MNGFLRRGNPEQENSKIKSKYILLNVLALFSTEFSFFRNIKKEWEFLREFFFAALFAIFIHTYPAALQLFHYH